jgi:hypothetical protein
MKQQINLRLTEDLMEAAEKYAKTHRYKNLQELAADALREKVTQKSYDESITPKEIDLVDKIIEMSIIKKKLRPEDDLMKALK